MSEPTRHQQVEDRLRELIDGAGLPAPDEVAHLRHSVAFVWYDTKAFIVVNLDELPEDGDPFEGLAPDHLAADILTGPSDDEYLRFPGIGPPGFAETG